MPAKCLRPALVSAFVGVASLAAHECWLQPSTFSPPVGAAVTLELRIGMEFRGEARPFAPQRVARLQLRSAAGTQDLSDRARGETQLPLVCATAGTHLVAYDSQPTLITLDGPAFRDYLVEEGLDDILAERERRGEADRPGRERYQRHNKSALHAGGVADATFTARTGQRLELVPLEDAAAFAPGRTARIALLLDGRPLPGAKVRAWHRAGAKLTTLDARTAADGMAEFVLPHAGEWMISAVHMARRDGDADADWESHWANLTFAVAAPANP